MARPPRRCHRHRRRPHALLPLLPISRPQPLNPRQSPAPHRPRTASPASTPAPARSPDRHAPRIPPRPSAPAPLCLASSAHPSTPAPAPPPPAVFRAILSSPRSSSTCTPAIRSRFGTFHRSPRPAAARLRAPLLPARNRHRAQSRTPAPPPAASPPPAPPPPSHPPPVHRPAAPGCRTIARTRSTTCGYGVPSGIRSRCRTTTPCECIGASNARRVSSRSTTAIAE